MSPTDKAIVAVCLALALGVAVLEWRAAGTARPGAIPLPLQVGRSR